MKPKPADKQLDGFIARYTPAIAALARAAFAKLRRIVPRATILVYDNYNALVIGFGPSERASEAALSLALYPRWVSLFFLQAAGLPDPDRLLRGNGKQARHVVLANADMLDTPAIQALIATALERARVRIDPTNPGRLIIKSVSEVQRPRRPAPKKGRA